MYYERKESEVAAMIKARAKHALGGWLIGLILAPWIFIFAWDWSGQLVLDIVGHFTTISNAAYAWEPTYFGMMGVFILVWFASMLIEKLTPKLWSN